PVDEDGAEPGDETDADGGGVRRHGGAHGVVVDPAGRGDRTGEDGQPGNGSEHANLRLLVRWPGVIRRSLVRRLRQPQTATDSSRRSGLDPTETRSGKRGRHGPESIDGLSPIALR